MTLGTRQVGPLFSETPQDSYSCYGQTPYLIRSGHEPPRWVGGIDAKTDRLTGHLQSDLDLVSL
jgi:hypothetical protein